MFNYQEQAARILIEKPDHIPTGRDYMLMWCALGLGGEAGEVIDHIKKGVCHQHGVDCGVLIKELGDVLWYVASICTLIDVSMSEVMACNIAKLELRYPDGYSSAASKTRAEREGR